MQKDTTLTETNTGRTSKFDVPEDFEVATTSVFHIKKLIAKQMHIPLNEINLSNLNKTYLETLDKLVDKKAPSYIKFMNEHMKNVVKDTNNLCYEVITEDNAAGQDAPPAELTEDEKEQLRKISKRKKDMIKEFPFSKG